MAGMAITFLAGRATLYRTLWIWLVAKEGGKHFFNPEPELDADQVIYGKRS